MKKRVLAFLMCLCVCMSLLPMAAMADGPQPATADFNVVLSVTLPEGYTGDSKVVTRKNIDANGNIVDFGDGKTYENGDIIPIKAGEWALFGFADIADHAGVWYHYASMNGGRVAVVDAPADGSDYTLCLGYNNTSGLRLGFMGSANINPGDNFGAGGLGSHPVGVYVDGVATSSFTVTSSDESVCTVTPDGTYITVTNVGYGTSVLTVTAGGYTEQFNWCCSNDEGEGEGEGPAAGPYTVNFQVNYPGDYEGDPVGGIRVYDFDVVPGPGADLSGLETAEYTDYTSLEEPIEMAAGEVFWYSVIPLEGYESISDYNDGDAFNNCTNGEYRAFIGNGGVEMLIMVTYGHNLGGEGEGPMGPQPATADFDVVINVELPEGYEGDGKVVTRMDRDENYNFVTFGDGAAYGNGDTVSVKAGEWALFSAEAMDGYIVEYRVNNASGCGTMGEGPDSSTRYAVIDGLAEGASAVELNVVYVALEGIMIECFGLVLSPGAGFGVGAFGDYEIPVLYDGERISDFTVTSGNEDVCTVTKNDNGVIVLTAVGYGDSVLTITANGETAEFTWHCEEDGSGEGPMGPVVSEDDYEIVLELGHEGFAEDELVGGGIVVFDEDGNHVGTYTESTTIPVSGGTKFLFRPIHAYGSDHSFEGISGTENGCYACYDDSTLRMTYVSCGTGGTETFVAPESDYTVDFEVVYDGFEPGMGFGGGIVVFDENGDYMATYTENQSITVPGGTVLLFQEIPILGAYSSPEGKQGEYGRMGIRWEAGEMTLAYTFFGGEGPGGDGEGPMGPQPAAMDFDVAIRVELPEDYEGDGKVVTRMDVDENGNIIASDDTTLYGHDDIISVKAGEWAVFGAKPVDGYVVNYIFNNAASFGTMNPDGSTRYAQIESVDCGDDPVEVIVEYISTAGITLKWDDAVIRPEWGFGIGGEFETTELRVLYNGEQITDFTVTNENDDVCTLAVSDDGVITLAYKGYGESVITVTANGETARFTWCCDPGPSGDTVTVTVNYPEDFALDRVGGVEIYDEDGNYLESCHGGDINVGEGGRLIVKVIEIEGADHGDSWRYCSDVEINGEMYRALDAGGSVEIEYYDRSQVGDPGITINYLASDSFIPAGVDITGGIGVHEMEVRLNGELIDGFTAYSSNESVCTVDYEGIKLTITGVGYGRSTIAIEYNGIVAEYTWICEGESPYSGITLAPEDAELEAIPAGGRFGMPVWGEYRYKVRLDTFFVGDFTVTSDNPDLCEVRVEGGYLVVNSKGYGETPIHVTVDGTTADFTWVCIYEEPLLSVKPPEAGAPKTDAALNGGSTVVSDITEDGNGSVLVLSSTIGDETSNIVVHTDNMEAIEEALEDENVTVGVVFGSRDVTDEEVSQEDEAAAEAYYTYQKELYADREITDIGIMDIFAELATVYPDRPGERLGAITEMDEMIEFSMTVKKSTLEELGRDIHNLFILHLHNGEWEEVWKDGGKYVETDDSYILYFKTNRFSSYVLGYDRVIGDIDGDDKPAEPTDLIRMMKYIAGEDVTVVADSVDVNRDNHVDILDVIRLMRAISGEDVTLG